jgi:hypothetical protein
MMNVRIPYLTLLCFFALGTTALAVPPGYNGDYEPLCNVRCARDGFSIEVLQHKTNNGYVLRFWPTNRTYTLDGDHNIAGDTYIGNQVAPFNNLPGSPYCTNYPGSGGTYIIGGVWERYLPSPFSYAETNNLGMGGNPCTDYSIPNLLAVLDAYATNDEDIPSFCHDTGCPSGGGGVDPDEPNTSGPFAYTDAAGNVVDFDDLLGDTPLNGGGGVNWAGIHEMPVGPVDVNPPADPPDHPERPERPDRGNGGGNTDSRR